MQGIVPNGHGLDGHAGKGRVVLGGVEVQALVSRAGSSVPPGVAVGLRGVGHGGLVEGPAVGQAQNVAGLRGGAQIEGGLDGLVPFVAIGAGNTDGRFACGEARYRQGVCSVFVADHFAALHHISGGCAVVHGHFPDHVLLRSLNVLVLGIPQPKDRLRFVALVDGQGGRVCNQLQFRRHPDGQ